MEVWLVLQHLRKETWAPRQLLWGGVALWILPFVPVKLSGGETWCHRVPSRKVRLGCEVPRLKYPEIKNKGAAHL